MSLPVLAYEKHSSVTGASGFFEKLRAFAQLQGWTLDSVQLNKEWGSASAGFYDWISGSDEYFKISSTGYGFQKLRYEFRISPYDDTVDMIEWAMVNPDLDTLNHATATHPIEQIGAGRTNYPSMYPTAQWVNFPAGVYPYLWLFGDERFILAVNQVTPDSFIAFSFGTLILPEEYWARTDLWCWWPVQRDALGNEETYRWDNIPDYLERWNQPFSYGARSLSSPETIQCTAYTCYLDGSFRWASEGTGKNPQQVGSFSIFYDPNSSTWQTMGHYCYARNSVGYNTWSRKHIPHSTIHFCRGASTNHTPIGHIPIAWIRWAGTGLQVGEEVVFGSEKYLAFPCSVSDSSYGYIVRIE